MIPADLLGDAWAEALRWCPPGWHLTVDYDGHEAVANLGHRADVAGRGPTPAAALRDLAARAAVYFDHKPVGW